MVGHEELHDRTDVVLHGPVQGRPAVGGLGVHIRPVLEQRGQQLRPDGVGEFDRLEQRWGWGRRALGPARGVGVGAGGEQRLDELPQPEFDRVVQRRIAAGVADVRVGLPLEEHLQGRGGVLEDGLVNGGDAAGGAGVDVRAGVEQLPRQRPFALSHRPEEHGPIPFRI